MALGTKFFSSKCRIVSLVLPNLLMKQEICRGLADVLNVDSLVFK